MANQILKQKVSFTTDGDGAATVYSKAFYGWLQALVFEEGDCSDGVDATFTTEGGDFNQTLLTLTNANDGGIYYLRTATHGNTGATDGGTTFPLIDGVVKCVIAQGGATKSGSFTLHWLEMA